MDSGDQEKERGITILSKNTAVQWRTAPHQHRRHPGPRDFGGEVERVLSMVDGVLLLVDAAEGPMPQTRFVLASRSALGLKPSSVSTRSTARTPALTEVLNEIFDLFVKLGATTSSSTSR
jgi:GTP-binding protein